MRWIFLFIFLFSIKIDAQIFSTKEIFSRQDSLRGTNNEFRNWWDVKRYDIFITPDFNEKLLKGQNKIKFKVNQENHMLQIDLQQPMQIDQIHLGEEVINDFQRDGNVYFVDLNENLKKDSTYHLTISFSGHPKIAINPPWNGGWIFSKDENSRPWMTVSCQGLGASVWYPNKDFQGDEPDEGASLTIQTANDQVGVANGRLAAVASDENYKTYQWIVENPINNYNLVPYIGNYKEIKDVFQGEKGKLDLSYWVLDYNVEKAKQHFEQTKPMLEAFEYWMGPYPFYEDGFKVVEAPHLGMEHQSAIAYGNGFENGYLGGDISQSGWGMNWDFILVHESAHEWFGNNITTEDVADMWVHEAFTSYAETLYTEYFYGKEAANDYVIGTRKRILNDRPIIGVYGVNNEGSTDMYFKGANMLHTLRQWLNDDELFRNLLRGMNQEFYHKIVTTETIENYIEQKTSLQLKAFFDQYLRTTLIPVLEYNWEGDVLFYRWNGVVDGFEMPVKIADSDTWLKPTENWQQIKLNKNLKNQFSIDRNFYIYTMQMK